MLKNVISALTSTAWAIMPEKMDMILQVLNNKMVAGEVDESVAVEARKRASKFKDVRADIGVIQILGTITHRPSAFASGGTSTEEIGALLDQAVADPSIGAIILDIDSPGGSVSGVPELSRKIFEARGKKPIIAIANSMMASAALWLGTAADEVVVMPSADIGSHGVLAVHTDTSEADEKAGIKTTIVKAGKHKAEGNSTEPLSDEALGALQSRVDEFFGMFTADLARNRGVSEAKVLKDFGQGRVLGAEAAVKAGMADKIGTFEQVVEDIQKPSRRNNARAQYDLIKLR